MLSLAALTTLARPTELRDDAQQRIKRLGFCFQPVQAINEVRKELPDFVLVFEELRNEALSAREDLFEEERGEFGGE